jgi:hypothetical protein
VRHQGPQDGLRCTSLHRFQEAAIFYPKPLRQRPQAGQLGRADSHGPRLGPLRPARAHLQAGSAWLRRVLNQAAQTAKRSPEFAAAYAAIAQRRGTKIATIAISRKLLTRA